MLARSRPFGVVMLRLGVEVLCRVKQASLGRSQWVSQLWAENPSGVFAPSVLPHNSSEDQLYCWALRLPAALPHPDSWWPVGNTVVLLDWLLAAFPEASDSCFRLKVINPFFLL